MKVDSRALTPNGRLPGQPRRCVGRHIIPRTGGTRFRVRRAQCQLGQSSVAGGLPVILRVEVDGGQTLGVYASWRSAFIRAPSNTDGSSIMVSYSSSSSSRSIVAEKYSGLLARRGYVCPIRPGKLRKLPASSRKLHLVCSPMCLRAVSLLRVRRSASSCGVDSIKRNENHSGIVDPTLTSISMSEAVKESPVSKSFTKFS